MSHFRWGFYSGDKSRGSAAFIEEACRFGMAPVIWADVRPSDDGYELNLWGVRLGDGPDYGPGRRSTHKGELDAHEAAERFATKVRKAFLERKLAELDAERAEIVKAIRP